MINAPIMNFDGAVFVEDNQNNRSFLERAELNLGLMKNLTCRFVATMKKGKKIPSGILGISALGASRVINIRNFQRGLPSGHPA